MEDKRLVRETSPDGKGKYALVRLDQIDKAIRKGASLNRVEDAVSTLYREGLLEYGEKGSDDEFFVLKLKDPHAAFAIRAYAVSLHAKCKPGEKHLVKDIFRVAERSEALAQRLHPDPAKESFCGWSLQDILDQADQDGVALTLDEAQEVMGSIVHHFDASVGVNWDTISAAIERFHDRRGNANETGA
jgi:hypothetical protein